MKNKIACALFLATFALCSQQEEDTFAPATVTITVGTTTKQADGQVTTDDLNLKAIVVTADQAEQLQADNETSKIEALKNSVLYDKVFVIADTTYIIQTEEEEVTNRTITVAADSQTTPDSIN